LEERPLHFWDDKEWSEITDTWPSAVKKGFARRLREVQLGDQPSSNAKPLSGFGIPLWELWHRRGQRVIYSTHYASLTGQIEVLDAFEKDSRHGRVMRTSDKDRIEARVAALKGEMEDLTKALQAQQPRKLN